MTLIKTILREIFGLFVDDAKFALAIILWVAIVRVLLPRISIPPVWAGTILFSGLALILAGSAEIYSRSRRSDNSPTSDGGSSQTSAQSWSRLSSPESQRPRRSS